MQQENDTIVALSSAPAPALRSIIRLSGPLAFDIADSLCPQVAGIASRRVPAELFVDDWQIAVEVFFYMMKAPRTYTCEDVVEIHLPGSAPLIHKVLDNCIAAGARLDLPGEFTRRAYLAGRIDLAQVEAVQALIAAADEKERKAAMRGLTGEISKWLHDIAGSLLEMVALLEAHIDFVEEDDIGIAPERQIMENLRTVSMQLDRLIANTGSEKIYHLNICLYGLPNAGKSTLFNALLEREAAITSHVSGTTLDWLEEDWAIGDLSIKLYDTPGITEQSSGKQMRAQNKAKSMIAAMDLVLFLIDGSKPISAEDCKLWQKIDKTTIFLIKTKNDLPQAWSLNHLDDFVNACGAMEICTKNQKDLDHIKKIIQEAAQKQNEGDGPGLLNLRQKTIAVEVKKQIEQAIQGFKQQMSYEFISVDLRYALNLIGDIVGKVTTEDILGKIFADFCIGK